MPNSEFRHDAGSETENVIVFFCQSSTYRDDHGAAPGRAPAGGAGALRVLRIAGSDQRRVILLGLVLQPGHLHAVSAHTPRKHRSATRVVVGNGKGNGG